MKKANKQSLKALESKLRKRKKTSASSDDSNDDFEPQRANNSKETKSVESKAPEKHQVTPLASDVWEALNLMMLRSIEQCRRDTEREANKDKE